MLAGKGIFMIAFNLSRAEGAEESESFRFAECKTLRSLYHIPVYPTRGT